MSSTNNLRPSYKIDVVTAERLIKNYNHILIAGVLTGKITKEQAIIGGTIQKDSIEGSGSGDGQLYSGNMAWYCLGSDNKLFAAFERNSKYRVGDNRPVFPDKSELVCPTAEALIHYDESGDVLNKLIKLERPIPANVDLKINKDKVIAHTTRFTSIEPFKDYNDNPFGFFANKKDIIDSDVDDFLEPLNMKYIRYFFGYDNLAGYENARLRIILIGTDAAGKNLLPAVPASIDTANNVILQTSWPPD